MQCGTSRAAIYIFGRERSLLTGFFGGGGLRWVAMQVQLRWGLAVCARKKHVVCKLAQLHGGQGSKQGWGFTKGLPWLQLLLLRKTPTRVYATQS